MRSMKYLIALGLILGVVSSVQAAETFVKEGKWQCQVANSVSQSLKGKKCTAIVTAKEGGTLITVVMDGAKGQEREEWLVKTVKGKTVLTQTERDEKGVVVGSPYTATALPTSTGTEKTFEINCIDRAAGKCDNGIDPNNTWTLKVTGDKFQYAVRGLKDKNNPKSLGERHLFEFQFAGK